MSQGPNQEVKLNRNTLRAETRAIWRATYVAVLAARYSTGSFDSAASRQIAKAEANCAVHAFKDFAEEFK